MRDSTFMTLMRLLPKSALSSFVGKATRLAAPAPLHRFAMRAFAKRYGVNMEEAAKPFEGYANFGEFFSRALKPGLRPFESVPDAIGSPCDGVISQLGYSAQGQCVQAKGLDFSIGQLLGDDASAHAFEGGAFATLYLSPKDYHRFHAPLEGQILGYSYLPGELWPVNPISVRNQQRLFCLNERLVTFIDTKRAGLLAYVAVGATCVGRIRASYEPEMVTNSGGEAKVHRYSTPIPLAQGDEVGWFEMGSTLILLFGKGRVKWEEGLGPGSPLRVGTRLGRVAQ